jgi:riboflavin kinase/FMN adenylyltransferase
MSSRTLIALDDTTSAAAIAAPEASIVIGNFDGVHRGHQAVLADALEVARARSLAPAVLTFDPHPSAIVGAGAPPMLTTMARRAELAASFGVTRVYARTFDAAFATWGPERFARELLSETLRARCVSVGENFRFASKRAGDLATLRALGAELGFEVHVHELACDAAGAFSSTRVRACVAAGDVAGAAEMLGRPHAISGVVAHGAKRGRTIGFPTANVEGIPEMLPPNGVYAVRVDRLDASGDTHALAPGVTNIGVRPTVGGEPRRSVEVYLLDWNGDLYDATLRVHLVARLRDEKRFAGLDELKAQIARDAADARKILLLPEARRS